MLLLKITAYTYLSNNFFGVIERPVNIANICLNLLRVVLILLADRTNGRAIATLFRLSSSSSVVCRRL